MKKNTINVWSYLEEYEDYEEEILQIVKEVFKSGRLILGENVKSFEQEFSKWVGNGYGTGVGNGTDAIKLALMSLGVKNGDEVITVSNTAVPTVSAIVDIGAKPVFCDVSEETYNIDPSKVEELITKKTKVILCVHLFGHPADVESLKEICKKNQIYLVEDCAQAHGAEYDKKKCGDFGDVSAFSFYPTKILGGFGDGGLVYSNSKEIDEKLKMLRFYGMKDQYFSEIDGVNSRLDELQAAILRFKLKRLDDDIARRREIANIYNNELIDSGLILPIEKKDNFHSYYLYVVRNENRDKIIENLKKNDINVNISYPWPIHTMPPFKNCFYNDLKNTEKLSKEIFSLPMYPKLEESQIQKTIEILKKSINLK